jgi:hypothetical protein
VRWSHHSPGIGESQPRNHPSAVILTRVFNGVGILSPFFPPDCDA